MARQNAKSETRNKSQYQNPNQKNTAIICSRGTRIPLRSFPCFFDFLALVSDFGIRISSFALAVTP